MFGLRLNVSDGQATISDDFNLVISGTQDAPVLVSALPDISEDSDGNGLTTGQEFTVIAPTANLEDPDATPLSFAARRADGTALPTWLSFDGQTFSGTAPFAAAGALDIELLASDGVSEVSDVFTLTIEQGTAGPITANDVAFEVEVPNGLRIDTEVLLENDDAGLTVVSVQGSDNAQVSLADGQVSYLADFGFEGEDQFT